MAVMMLTLAVDVERMGSNWGAVQLQQAVRRCQGCTNLMSCRHWLKDPHRPADGYREFCPNAGLFDRYCTPDRRRTSRLFD
jgi:hypothetical protein